MNERLCGDKLCFGTSLREDLNILAKSQNKIVELLTEQKSIIVQLNGLKDEFNRSRDIQYTTNTSVHLEIKDINRKMITSKDMKIYIALLGFSTMVFSLILTVVIR